MRHKPLLPQPQPQIYTGAGLKLFATVDYPCHQSIKSVVTYHYVIFSGLASVCASHRVPARWPPDGPKLTCFNLLRVGCA